MSDVGSLVRLLELLPSPDVPVRAYGDWKRFVSMNGFPPPEDYRMMIREYGAGTFGEWIHLIEPFNTEWSFIEKAEVECRALRGTQRQDPQAYPDWPIWPDPGGMLPWATTATDDHIGWRTTGRPHTWTTLFWGAQGYGSSELPVGAVGFLIGHAEGSLGSGIFGEFGTNAFLIEGRSRFLPAGD